MHDLARGAKVPGAEDIPGGYAVLVVRQEIIGHKHCWSRNSLRVSNQGKRERVRLGEAGQRAAEIVLNLRQRSPVRDWPKSQQLTSAPLIRTVQYIKL